MKISPGNIVYFKADQRGKCTMCCGEFNSKKGEERPFLILSNKKWHERHSDINTHFTDIYALPISRLKDWHTTNTWVEPISEESLSSSHSNLIGSNILCDSLCRISKTDLHNLPNPEIKVKDTFRRKLLNKVKSFLGEECFAQIS